MIDAYKNLIMRIHQDNIIRFDFFDDPKCTWEEFVALKGFSYNEEVTLYILEVCYGI